MAAAERVVLDIEKLVAGGDGLAHLGGRAVFVPLALPGEEVEAELVEERRDFLRARLLEVRRASPDRVEAPCPHFGACGGCRLQELSAEGQGRAARALVRDIYLRGTGQDPGEPPLVSGSPWGYRNRFQFHLDAAGRLGLMRLDSTEVLPLQTCLIASEEVRDWLEGFGGGDARPQLPPAAVKAGRFVVFGAGGRLWIEGRHERVGLKVGGDLLHFPLSGFFQSNLALLERLIPAVTGAAGGPELPPGSRAADLFAGVGLFGHFLSKAGLRVVMVEENVQALAEARANAPGPRNEWHGSSVEAWCSGPGARASFDYLVVDPPRSGLPARLRAWIAERRPPRIAYVSCDPVTQARDARDLFAAAYRLVSLSVYDFYPQTGHLETLALFEAGAPA
jgi:23S rRNA (uracil1939-C5)-methyltransferase